ncbi:MAG: hypothetical protein SGJ27_14200 [Candidatus Melainabacteria bacterium]|nr:hypothetical protein [Candidatus Melainabacteria bacterium]
MDAQPPPKPALTKQLSPQNKRKLDLFLNSKTRPIPTVLKVQNYGPIASMTLGDDWTDIGERPNSDDKFHGGNWHRWRNYKLAGDGGTLRVHARSEPCADDDARNYREFIKTHNSAVDKAEYDKFRYLFGMAGNPRFFTVESIEVVELGGIKVVAMSGQNTEDSSREKTIYVSPSGDWKEAYNFGIGVSAGKDFDKAVEKFDKALSTVVWSKK